MNDIQKILYKHLSRETITMIGMGKKVEDVRWLIRHGYVEDFKANKKGFRVSGEVTEKGQKFFANYEKTISNLFEKADKNLTDENERKTFVLVRDYVKTHSKTDFSISSDVYKGLTDDEKYAFLHFAQDPLNIGRR